MHGLIKRNIENTVKQRLEQNPAVALLGARQVGKSTLAGQIIKNYPDAIYLDLEKPSDLNKLHSPELFFEQFQTRLVCLDEIQRLPEIFSLLRGVIDNNKHNAQFLILGSASRDLIKQSSESLAGRLSYIEVTPFLASEVNRLPDNYPNQHWLRGGYPRSFLSNNDENSLQWREDYIQTYLERDIPQLGFNIPANTLGRFWRMLAHSHGQILNASKLAGSMGVSAHTIRKYIDLLEQTFITRNLQPYFANTKKRLIKSPKVYIRDTGLLHALLNIENMEELFSHPVYGVSYEGYVIENLLSNLKRWRASFYRTSNGAEIDLILERGTKTIAIEIKASLNPKVSKGFWTSIESIKPDYSYIVAPVNEEYPLEKKINVIPMLLLIEKLC
jgi:predicted AAA+ superfamily ATPase